MTTSSQQPDYSTILSSDDVITITGYDSTYTYGTSSSVGNITLTGGTTAPFTSTYTISSDTISFPNSIDTITIGNIFPQEFVNAFPDWDKIEKMRKEYPGLDIAMKKFEEVYKMVEDDWQAQQGNKYGGHRS